MCGDCDESNSSRGSGGLFLPANLIPSVLSRRTRTSSAAARNAQGERSSSVDEEEKLPDVLALAAVCSSCDNIFQGDEGWFGCSTMAGDSDDFFVVTIHAHCAS